MLGCESQHLILSAAWLGLSEDGYARLLSVNIAEFVNGVSGWLSNGVGPRLGQALVGQSLSFCSIFISAHLVDRVNFGSKVL